MSTQAWIDFILEHDVVGFFDQPVRLKSGRTSHYYVNWRSVSEDTYLIDQATDFIVDFIAQQGWSPDCIFGVPEGASKLALLSQYKWAQRSPHFAKGSHVFAMGRGKPKEHGPLQDRAFLGHPRGQVVLLEDVTTTGDSLLRCVEQLRQLDLSIVAAVCLTDRMEPRQDGQHISRVLDSYKIPFVAMSQADQFLPAAIEKQQPSDDVKQALQQERSGE